MRINNTNESYGIVTILLHWLMALLIIGMLGLGLYMTSLTISPQKLKLYGWHKEFGFLILMLAIFRLAWRLRQAVPNLSLPTWEKIAARTVHYLFYLLMFAMPLTGWLMTSAAGLSVSFFKLFIIPNIISPNPELKSLFANIHALLAYALIGLIVLHVSAALKHHFFDKDHILRRMLSC